MKHWTTLKKLIWLKFLRAAAAVLKTVTGNAPLTLTNALARAIHSLTQTGLCAQASTPTPSAPVDIVCNNGAIKFGWHDIITTSQLSGYGTYVSPSQTATTRAYRWFRDLPNGTYTFAVSGDYEIIVQWRDPADPADGLAQGYENLTGWITSGEVTLGKTTGGYGIAVRRTSGTDSITPSNFDGTLHVAEQRLYIDGTPEVLTVYGKNLINEAACTLGVYVNPTTGVIEDNSNYCTTEKMYLANGTYTYSQDRSGSGSTNDRLNIATYNADDTPIEVVYTGYKQETVTFTLSGSYAYVRISYRKTNTDIMLEAGDTATAYQPYFAQTASVPMLLSVGDYADEAELISGIKTGKVGVKVFDGTEDWQKQSGVYRYYIDISDASTDNAYIPICTHFKGVSGSTAWSNINDGEFKHASSVTRFYFQNDACTSASDFSAFVAAQYAAGTPVIVLYPLATETTEQGTAHHLVTHEGTNIVDSTANVSPIEIAVEYYGTEE